MRIAVLGWGSLIKEPRTLRMVGRRWHRGGPLLPIELSRHSRNRGHLTYVIDERHKRRSRTRYVISLDTNLQDAIANLAECERCPQRRIGYVKAAAGTRRRSRTSQWKTIQTWVRGMSLDAAVWTDLPPKPGRFTLDAAVRGWRRLAPEKQRAAADYVRMAPRETDTDLRRRLRTERLA